jgi:hypothetical protein
MSDMHNACRPYTVNENFSSILNATFTVLPGTNMLIPRFSHRNNSDGHRSAPPTFGKLGLGRATVNQMVYVSV